MHSFRCFVMDLNGASSLLDFKSLRTRAMASLYDNIGAGKLSIRIPFRESIAFTEEEAWVRAERPK